MNSFIFFKVGFVTLNCKSALSCAKGCQLGYKCGAEGCPTCACVEAKGMLL